VEKIYINNNFDNNCNLYAIPPTYF